MGCCCSQELPPEDEEDVRTPLLGSDNGSRNQVSRKYDTAEDTRAYKDQPPPASPEHEQKSKSAKDELASKDVQEHQKTFSAHLTQWQQVHAMIQDLSQMYPDSNTDRSLRGCLLHVHSTLGDKSSVRLREDDPHLIDLVYSKDQMDKSLIPALDDFNKVAILTRGLLQRGPQLSKAICDSIAKTDSNGSKQTEQLKTLSEDLEKLQKDLATTMRAMQSASDVFKSTGKEEVETLLKESDPTVSTTTLVDLVVDDAMQPDQEKLQQEKLQQEQQEQEQQQLLLQQEKLQQEKIQQEKLQQEQLHQEKLQQEKLQQEKLQQEQQKEQEKLQQEKLQQQLQQEKLQQEKLQQEKLQQEKLQQEQQKEQEKLQQEKLQQEKLQQEQQKEQENLQQEKLQQEKLQQEKLQQEQQYRVGIQDLETSGSTKSQEQITSDADDSRESTDDIHVETSKTPTQESLEIPKEEPVSSPVLSKEDSFVSKDDPLDKVSSYSEEEEDEIPIQVESSDQSGLVDSEVPISTTDTSIRSSEADESFQTEESEDPNRSNTDSDIFHDTREDESLDVTGGSAMSRTDESDAETDSSSCESQEDSCSDSSSPDTRRSQLPSTTEQVISSVEYEMASEGTSSAKTSLDQPQTGTSPSQPQADTSLTGESGASDQDSEDDQRVTHVEQSIEETP